MHKTLDKTYMRYIRYNNIISCNETSVVLCRYKSMIRMVRIAGNILLNRKFKLFMSLRRIAFEFIDKYVLHSTWGEFTIIKK